MSLLALHPCPHPGCGAELYVAPTTDEDTPARCGSCRRPVFWARDRLRSTRLPPPNEGDEAVRCAEMLYH